MQVRIVSTLEPLKPLPIHSGKSKDMGQQRTLGIKPPALHHHTDAVQRQLFQPTALFRLNLSRQPHETLVLPKLSHKLIASNMKHRRKMTGDGRRALQRVWYAEH